MGTERAADGHDGPTDDLLIARIAVGDRTAFGTLYDRTHRVVLAVVVRTLVDFAQSEEVVQEVFLELWQNAARFDRTRGSARAWLMTMSHRRAVDRVRASQTSRTRDSQAGFSSYSPAFDHTYEVVETKLEHDRVTQALRRITPLQRETVVMGYHHGRSLREISDHLGVPISTIKTRMRDGLARLRLELDVA